MRTCSAAVTAVAFGLCVWGCGPSPGANSANPAGPSSTSGSIVVIDVVGVDGPGSFRPNPANIVAGQMVVWRNLDSVTHRIGFDDRSLDTGNIASGTSSSPMPIQGEARINAGFIRSSRQGRSSSLIAIRDIQPTGRQEIAPT